MNYRQRLQMACDAAWEKAIRDGLPKSAQRPDVKWALQVAFVDGADWEEEDAEKRKSGEESKT